MTDAIPMNPGGVSTEGAGEGAGNVAVGVVAAVVDEVWASDTEKRVGDRERERTSPRARFRVKTMAVLLAFSTLVPIFR